MTPEASSEVVTWLTTESRAIARLLTPRFLLLSAVAMVGAWLFVRLVDWLLRTFWRFGGDSARRLQWLVPAARVIVTAALGYALLVGSFRAAPVLTVVVTVTTMSLLLVAFTGPLRSAYVGLGVSWRSRIRPGDRFELGDHAGIVQRFGLFRIELRDATGATVVVPNRLLEEGIVRIAAVKNTRLVRARVGVQEDSGLMGLRLQRVAMLSPYRVAGSPVTVTMEDGFAEVVISVWGDDALQPAAAQLEAVLVKAAGKVTRQG